jgi:ankyrin repeat protein
MRARISLCHCQGKDATRAVIVASLAALAGASAWQSAAATITNAARDADIDEVRQLIQSGEDVNAPEADGTSALLWASYQAYPELVTLLIEAGADPNAANEFGITPLLQASRNGDAPTIKVLLDAGADIKMTHPGGETALMAAARSGSVESVSLLLDRGADPNAFENLQHQTALMWATVEGHLDVVDTLLNAGADPNLQARSRRSWSRPATQMKQSRGV